MSEKAPSPANPQQQQAVVEEQYNPTRGLRSSDFAVVQSEVPSFEASQPKGDWDFGGASETAESTQINPRTEHAPFLARQKSRLAAGIGKLAAIGNRNHANTVVTQQEVDEPMGLHQEELEGIKYSTNLPKGFSPFEPTEPGYSILHPAARALLPSAVDDIPAGEYIVEKPESKAWRWLKEDKKIIVTDWPDGKRINEIDVSGVIKQSGRPEKLMTALGYQFEENVLDEGTADEVVRYGKLKAVPTPNTLHAKATALGVDIKFIPDQGHIDNPTYLQAFAEGKYPVSSARADYYTHDTTDDHLTAMVLGSTPLKDALRQVSETALNQEGNQTHIVEGIDEFTARLRLTIAYDGPYLLYSPDGLRKSGAKIGLDAATVDEILETAQANARKFDMKVTEHPVGS